jgi:hypothetical protein
MTRLNGVMPGLAVTAWFAAIVVGVAFAALSTTEPPMWDALSYLQKALTFWQAVDAGKPFNPFDLPMTVRPPGTILMSYPLGWSDDYRWFYFRSVVIPVGLLIAAVYLAGYRVVTTRKGHWVLAALAIALAGMPMLFRFQMLTKEGVYAWGLVDGFLAGVAALAAAAVIRSATSRSVGWAAAAAALAAFCLLIKPAGALLMAATGAAWLVLSLNPARLRADGVERRFLILSLAVAAAIFALIAFIAFTSAYFSAENIAFGKRVFAMFEQELGSVLNWPLMLELTRDSFGYVVPVIVLAGLFVRNRASGAALVCLLAGLWFWLFQTDASQIRYFVPFGAMAFVLLVPSIIRAVDRIPPAPAYALSAIAVTPAAITAILLFTGGPPAWQRFLGISLDANAYAAENAQAADFLRQLEADGVRQTMVYVADTTPALRNVLAVLHYPSITNPALPQVSILGPVDWQSPTATRMGNLLDSDYVAFEPIEDTSLLAQRDVADFETEAALVNAWLTTLTPADGVEKVSQTRVALLRISDRSAFGAALERFEAAHQWPASHAAANPQRWWSPAEIEARGALRDIGFGKSNETLVRVRGVETDATDGLQVKFWIEGDGSGWKLFAHAIDSDGQIVGNAEATLSGGRPPAADKPIRYYTVNYPVHPAGARAIAFGFLRPGVPDNEALTTTQQPNDWNGRRFIVPLSR